MFVLVHDSYFHKYEPINTHSSGSDIRSAYFRYK